MRKVLLVGVTVLVLTGLSASLALAKEGWYVGASAGSTDQENDCDGLDVIGFVGSCDETDTGWKIFVGKQGDGYWGVEFGFVDLGESTASGTIAGIPVSAKAEADGFTFAVTGTFPFGDKERSAFLGKVGLLRWDVDTQATGSGIRVTENDEGAEFMFGVGLKYDLTERIGIRGEWEKFGEVGDDDTTGKSDIKLFSVGVDVWF